MSRKLSLAFAASLPIALVACGGGSTPAQTPVPPPDGSSGPYVQSRVQDLNITHLEMTDWWIVSDEFSVDEAVCDRGTGCTVDGVSYGMPMSTSWKEGLFGVSDQSNGFALFRPNPINRVELSFKSAREVEVVASAPGVGGVAPAPAPDIDPGPTGAPSAPGGVPSVPRSASNGPTPVLTDTVIPAVGEYISNGPTPVLTNTVIAGVGHYSGFFTVISSTDEAGYRGGYSSAFGDRHLAGRPSATATWRGAMVGQSRGSMGNGAQLAGNAVLTYSIADNTIDVALSQISAYGSVTYSGPRSFDWYDLAVNSDGTFQISQDYTNERSETRLHPTLGYIEGDFYGPNAEETAGVFERGFVQGAWMAIKDNN